MARHMTIEDREEIWLRLEAGETLTEIAAVIDRTLSTLSTFVIRNGGRRPREQTPWSDKRMSLEEREEISRGLALGESFRSIAKRIGRAPSTVSRDVKSNGGRDGYRAVDAEASVRQRARRPRKRRLECDRKLREVVEAGLDEFWSPMQISQALVLEYPHDLRMRISHESIYEATYRHLLTRKPHQCLRTKRRRRVPRHRRKATGPGVIKDRLMIRDRPGYIENRMEPGHWEGDLIIGNGSTALANLVERMTRYAVLVQLPGKRTMEALNHALAEVYAQMPRWLVRTLTWDQGKEIAGHKALADLTGLSVYVCDRSSPWQRGTNENTNGLLRQWWPRSTNFYTLDPAEIQAVQTSLNGRPRQVLEWRTPASALKLKV